MSSRFVYDDGGRAAAGFAGRAKDCFTRAVAIASQEPYRKIYDFVNLVAKDLKEQEQRRRWKQPDKAVPKKFRHSLGDARRGVRNALFHEVMLRLGWKWTPTMHFGQGCKVHLRKEELPSGRLVVRVTKHMVAMLDGVIHDTHDPSRESTRCVYGYFSKATEASTAAPLRGQPVGRKVPPQQKKTESGDSNTAEAASPPGPLLKAKGKKREVCTAKDKQKKHGEAVKPAVQKEPSACLTAKKKDQAQISTVSPEGSSFAAHLQREAPTPTRSPLTTPIKRPLQMVSAFSDDDSDEEVRQRLRHRRQRPQSMSVAPSPAKSPKVPRRI